ncbi:MAG: MotA/TolQ/ExbB proton channel family protein, partial [Planctomycetes bacterium]|nr:MotA/TolQ/ExbB proton channel family protein [Planctomycetota bacterium]
TIAAFAAALPLLGLLGTVGGMVTMFEAVAETGTRNATLVSGGIAQALLTTQVGLVTALPGIFLLEKIRRQRSLIEYDLEIHRSAVRTGRDA